MRYLDIGSVIKQSDNYCIGYINTRRYTAWKKVDPMILLIEGIHQFCVKSVKKIMPQKGNIQLVPVQLKNIQMSEIIHHGIFKITGKLSSMSEAFSINFVVSKKGLLATGTVIVSDLKEISE